MLLETGELQMVLVLIDQKTKKPDHLKKWLSANDRFVLKVGPLNSTWRKNMTQYKLTAWWSEKIKVSYGKSSAEIIAVDTSVNSAYRKASSHVGISHFFEKRFDMLRSVPTMKSCGTVLSVLLVLTGCLATPIKPSISKMAEIRSILVVPVESSPLQVIPDLIETRFPVYRQYQYQAMPFYVFLEEKIYSHPGGVLIAGLVSKDDSVSVAELHQTSDSLDKSASLELATSLSEYWSPSFVLAQEAVSQLNRDGVKAVLSKHYYRLAIASGDRNANLGNWHNAIGQWYNQSMSSIDYRRFDQEHVDAVLEVGIDSYRIFDAQTSLQVLIKLIDPKTRQVIGRISEKTFSVEDSPQTLLHHEAEKFKRLMTGMGAQLVARGFSGLGLSLKVSGQHIKPAQSAVDGLTP